MAGQGFGKRVIGGLFRKDAVLHFKGGLIQPLGLQPNSQNVAACHGMSEVDRGLHNGVGQILGGEKLGQVNTDCR